MILRRYGTSYHSVATNFNSTAMTEVGFQRDREFSVSVEEFDASYKLIGASIELGASCDAPVQRDAEARVLEILKEGLDQHLSGLSEGQVLVILSDRDEQPKTRERRESVIVDGENRFHFHWWIEPVLRVGIYRRVE